MNTRADKMLREAMLALQDAVGSRPQDGFRDAVQAWAEMVTAYLLALRAPGDTDTAETTKGEPPQ